MKIILSIYKKEIKEYILSPIAYIYTTAFLLFTGWYFFRKIFLINQSTMLPLFEILPWIFLLFIPAISMRSWAEEKRSETLDFLLTFPIKESQLILGKYFAAFTFVLITTAATLPFLVIICLLGQPDFGPIISGYLASILLGGSFLSIGFLASSLTKNQIIAFIAAFFLSLFLYASSANAFLYSTPGLVSPILEQFTLESHFTTMVKGIISIYDIVYFLSVIIFFLYLNAIVLGARKLD